MRIALVAQPFERMDPPVRGGSLAIWIYQVARRIAKTGHEVFVMANHGARFSATGTQYDAVNYLYTPTAVNALVNRGGIAFTALRRRAGWRDTLPDFAASWCDAGYAMEASRAAKRLKCDAVLVMNYSQIVPVLRKVHRSCKIYLYMQCEWLTQLDHESMRQRIDAADVIGGCSEYITRKIAARFPQYQDKCVTLTNAANPVQEFQDDARKDGPKSVLFVGRVSPEKGLHVLVQAFHLVLREFPDAKLDIVGGIGSAPIEYLVGLSDDAQVAALRRFYDGSANGGKDPYFAHLERASGAELGKRIVFHGHVDHDRTTAAYRTATVLTNPSLSESFGMSLVEAMMHSVPVVATRIGGMPYIVQDGVTGWLIDGEDEHALAAAICKVLRDPATAREMGQAGRRRALDKFSWDRTAATLLEQLAIR
jgi:glycosyltransferase involved in cell wall biosynthesis